MRKRSLAALLIGLGLIMSGCQKDQSENTRRPQTVEAQRFSFATESLTHFNITLNGGLANGVARIDIYADYNKPGQHVLSSKFIAGQSRLSFDINLPTYLDEVYLAVVDGKGITALYRAAIVGNRVDLRLGPVDMAPALALKNGFDCSTGCDVSYSSMSKNLVLSSAQVYCFNDVTDNKHLTVKAGVGATVRICGSGIYKNVNIGAGNTLLIADGAEVDFSQLNVDQNAVLLIGHAQVDVMGTLDVNGNATNYGHLEVDQHFNINGQGDFTNNGALIVGGGFNNNNELTNNDSIISNGNIHFNGNSTTVNRCYIYGDQHLQFNGECDNFGYIGANGAIHFNGGSLTNLHDGAMIEGGSAQVNSLVSGLGATSLIKIATTTHIGGAGVLQGNLAYCDGDGSIEVNNGTLVAPATFSCAVFIPATGCNPGFGSPDCPDSDLDGVCDSIDKFPNNPALAGCDCYPDCESFATLAFEDLWPYNGDYDFNDLVMDYRYTMYTNASNEVVKMKAHYLIKAIGAQNINGFGLQLEGAGAMISAVDGQLYTEGYVVNEINGAEAGQGKATLIFFDNNTNAFKPGGGLAGFINTLPGKPYVNPDTISLMVHFVNPQPMTELGVAPFNPFMISRSDRRREIHLKNYMPTDLADLNILGTGHDASDILNGISYCNQEGLPWAINIPGSFEYPSEYNAITDAYLHFAEWITSGGLDFPDWYYNLAPGYRNAALIY